MKKIFLFIFIFNAFSGKSQDAVFSQYYHNPPTTNPALTGVFNGQNRVGTSIRTQWYSVVPNASLTTTDIFYDLRMNIINDDYLGLGVMLLDDRTGVAQIGKAHGYLNLSYSKHLTYNKYNETNQYLVFGTQAGYGLTYLDNSGFLFGSQFNKNTEIVEPSIPSGENLLNSKFYPDINIGLLWYVSGRENNFYLGGAISHINRPDISLISGNSDRLAMKYSGLMGGEFTMRKGISILPSIFFNMQGSIVQSMVGSNIRLGDTKDDDNAYRIGFWARLTNSVSGIEMPDIIFSSILEFNRIELGLSYDVNVSGLSKITGYKGAFELSLLYVWGENPNRFSVECPRF